MRRLSPQQLVSVNLPFAVGRRDGPLEFQVVAVIDSVVALEPLERSDTRLVPDRVLNCLMAFDHQRGVFGLKGHLYQRIPGDWRFKVTDPVSRPGDSSFRIRVCAPITVAPCDEHAGKAAIETETVNLGADGVLIDGGTDWSPPERARLTLSILGDDEPIEARAVLVAREGALCNFKYEAMNANARNRLGCFIIDHQRDSLRRRKDRYRAEIAGLDDDICL
jgi:hypothetical protein